jgi:hypothetical protein
MLKGSIMITDKPEVIYNINLINTKIVNLDEDDILQKSDQVIEGICLLPPMESKVAEADGNEFAYDAAYRDHLLAPYQQQFISAIVSALYKGINIILFLPEIGYNYTREKLLENLYVLFGIHVGIIGDPDPIKSQCFYDNKCIPMWLNMVYCADVISYNEYLYMYPTDAQLNNNVVINKLLSEMRPYGTTTKEQIDYIKSFHKKIKRKPNLILAIHI